MTASRTRPIRVVSRLGVGDSRRGQWPRRNRLGLRMRQVLYGYRFLGSLDEVAIERGAGADQGDLVSASTARQRPCAALTA